MASAGSSPPGVRPLPRWPSARWALGGRQRSLDSPAGPCNAASLGQRPPQGPWSVRPLWELRRRAASRTLSQEPMASSAQRLCPRRPSLQGSRPAGAVQREEPPFSASREGGPRGPQQEAGLLLPAQAHLAPLSSPYAWRKRPRPLEQSLSWSLTLMDGLGARATAGSG